MRNYRGPLQEANEQQSKLGGELSGAQATVEDLQTRLYVAEQEAADQKLKAVMMDEVAEEERGRTAKVTEAWHRCQRELLSSNEAQEKGLQRLESLERDLLEASEEKRSAQEEVGELRLQIALLEEEAREAADRARQEEAAALAAKDDKSRSHATLLAQAADEKASLASALGAANEETERCRASIAQLEDRVTCLGTRLQEARLQADRAAAEKLVDHVTGVIARLALAELKERSGALTQQRDASDTALSETRKALRAAEDECSGLREGRCALLSRIGDLQSLLQHQEEQCKAFFLEKSDLIAGKEVLETRVADLGRACEQLRTELANAQASSSTQALASARLADNVADASCKLAAMHLEQVPWTAPVFFCSRSLLYPGAAIPNTC